MNRGAKFSLLTCLFIGMAILSRTPKPLLTNEDVLSAERAGMAAVREPAKPAWPDVREATNKQVQEAYGKLPLSFEANQGQTDGRVKFLSRGSGYALFLTSNEAILEVRRPRGKAKGRGGFIPPDLTPDRNNRQSSVANRPSTVLRMKLVGANRAPQVAGLAELPGKSNYFIGNDPRKWRTHVPNYRTVRYQGVYPGVDLVYYGNQRQLEYDFVVAPGADPKTITLGIEVAGGADRGFRPAPDRREHEGAGARLRINTEGDIVVPSDRGEVRFHKPVVYQVREGTKHFLSGRYVLRGRHGVGFQVTAYDAARPLVVDPLLSYSTYLGGSDFDKGLGIAADLMGNAYVTGFTCSSNFPTGNPLQATLGGSCDAFVTKLNRPGSARLYSTYLGGSGFDAGLSIVVDRFGNAYVAGDTESPDFPTANPLQGTLGGDFDAFVAKLNPAGSALLYSTYLGGSGADDANSIAVDRFGNAYVTGETVSTDFPTANPLQATLGGDFDAFVAKLNPAGSALLYSTYLGGSGADVATSIAVDRFGNAYVTGETDSPDFPTANPLQASLAGDLDAFVAKLNPAGSALLYSTYLGGSGTDDANGIAVDRFGNAYVTGETFSTDFPTANPLQAILVGGLDAFVAKLNPAGSALLFSTYLGGSGDDEALSIAVGNVNVYVTGFTDSPDFPTANAVQGSLGGGTDAFVTELNPAGSALLFSTYLGGSGGDEGFAIAVDNVNVYVTGFTDSTDFPTANPLQATVGGGFDAFVAKLRGVPAGP